MSNAVLRWAFLQTHKMGCNEGHVLIRLANQSKDSGLSWPSLAFIAKHTGQSKSTVQRAIASLVELGFLRVEPRRFKGNQTSNFYYLIGDWREFLKERNVSEQLESDFDGQLDAPPSQVDYPPSQVDHLNRNRNCNIPNTTYLEDIADAPPPLAPSERVISPAKQFWDEALGILLELGLSDKQARSFIGKCLKTTGGKMEMVSAALNEASLVGTRDPIPYVTAILNSGGVSKKSEQKRKVDEAFAYLDARIAAEEAMWLSTIDSKATDSLTGGKDDTGVLPPIPDAGSSRVCPDSGAGDGAISGGSARKGRFPNLRDFGVM